MTLDPLMDAKNGTPAPPEKRNSTHFYIGVTRLQTLNQRLGIIERSFCWILPGVWDPDVRSLQLFEPGQRNLSEPGFGLWA